MARIAQNWTPADWRSHAALQQPDYPNPVAAAHVLDKLRVQGPLVTPAECRALLVETGRAARGEAFIVQAGDCAESLASDAPREADAMSGLVERLTRLIPGPTVKMARIAGQFAKPRSAALEVRGDAALPSYRGDAINGEPFDAGSRTHRPERLLRAYDHAVATIGHLRANRAPLFTSHEALLLGYEEALCTRDADGRWWAGSGHMLWIGDRTRQVDGAHVVFAAGIGNAVGIKCGPTIADDEMLRLAERIDPDRRPGKLIFIARLGANRIGDRLPSLLRAAQREGLAAAWMVDPMHGNTRLAGGRKQRRVADMAAELESFFSICVGENVQPAGLHLEVSARPVHECVDRDEGDPAADFPCDPRLNEEQAAQLVGLAAERLRSPVAA